MRAFQERQPSLSRLIQNIQDQNYQPLIQQRDLSFEEARQISFLSCLTSYLNSSIKLFNRFILDNQNKLHRSVYHTFLISLIPSILELKLFFYEKLFGVLFLLTSTLSTPNYLLELLDLDDIVNYLGDYFSHSPLALSTYHPSNEMAGSELIKALTFVFSSIGTLSILDLTIDKSSLNNKILSSLGSILTLKVLAELTQRLPVDILAEITHQNARYLYYSLIGYLPYFSRFNHLHQARIIYLIKEKEFQPLLKLLCQFKGNELIPSDKSFLIQFLIKHFENDELINTAQKAGTFFKKESQWQFAYLFYQISVLCLKDQMKASTPLYYRSQFNCGYALDQLASEKKDKESIETLLKEAKKRYEIATQSKGTISDQSRLLLAPKAAGHLTEVNKKLAIIKNASHMREYIQSEDSTQLKTTISEQNEKPTIPTNQ